MIALMLEAMLEDFGCQVVALASSPDEAIAAVRGHVLDGVLMDMNLRGQNTHSIANELRERSVPFLLVTGYDGLDSDPPEIEAAPRLKKPFSQDELARRMEEAFGVSRGRHQQISTG